MHNSLILVSSDCLAILRRFAELDADGTGHLDAEDLKSGAQREEERRLRAEEEKRQKEEEEEAKKKVRAFFWKTK